MRPAREGTVRQAGDGWPQQVSATYEEGRDGRAAQEVVHGEGVGAGGEFGADPLEVRGEPGGVGGDPGRVESDEAGAHAVLVDVAVGLGGGEGDAGAAQDV